MELATLVCEIAREEQGIEADVELVATPRGNETLVEDFGVETSVARDDLGWSPEQTVEEGVRRLLQERTASD